MVEKPEEISQIEYSQESNEYIIFTDTYGAVLNTNSIIDSHSPKIIGEIDVSKEGNYESINWAELSVDAQLEIQSYVLNQTTDKGDRNEREAANILSSVRGSGNVDKVSSYSNHDPFGLVDVIGVGGEWDNIMFLQVKTNTFTAEEKRKYKRDMRRLNLDYIRFEVWVRVDYKGWRMYQYNQETEEFELELQMNSADFDKTVERFRDRENFWDD